MSERIHIVREAREQYPMCCDGRCLDGYCPQQDACAIRAAADEKERGRQSAMERSVLGARLRKLRVDHTSAAALEAQESEYTDAIHEHGVNRALLGRALAGLVVLTGLTALAIWAVLR